MESDLISDCHLYVVQSGSQDGSSVVKIFLEYSSAEKFALEYMQNITKKNHYADSFRWTRTDRNHGNELVVWSRTLGFWDGKSGKEPHWRKVHDLGPHWISINRHRLDSSGGVDLTPETEIQLGTGSPWELDWKYRSIQIGGKSFMFHNLGDEKYELYRVEYGLPSVLVWSWHHKPSADDIIRDWPLIYVHQK